MKEIVLYVLERLNVKAVSMTLSVFLGISGCMMIVMGIRDTGSIDIRTPFLTGEAKSGFVGVLLVFLSMVITLACLVVAKSRAHQSTHTLVVKRGDKEFTWQGVIGSKEELAAAATLLASHFAEEAELLTRPVDADNR